MHKILILFIAILILCIGNASANSNDGELVQINSTHWYFEITQTKLSHDEFNYQAFANNISSDNRTVRVNLLGSAYLYYDVYNFVSFDASIWQSGTPVNATLLKAASTQGTANVSMNSAGTGEEYNFTINSGTLSWINVTSGLSTSYTYTIRYSSNDTAIKSGNTGSNTYLNLTSLNLGAGTYYIDGAATATESATRGYGGGGQNQNTSIIPAFLQGNASGAEVVIQVSSTIEKLYQDIQNLIGKPNQPKTENSMIFWGIITLSGLALLTDGISFKLDKKRDVPIFKLKYPILIATGGALFVIGLIYMNFIAFI